MGNFGLSKCTRLKFCENYVLGTLVPPSSAGIFSALSSFVAETPTMFIRVLCVKEGRREGLF